MSTQADLEAQRLYLIKLRKYGASLLRECFDPIDLDTRPTEAQEEIFRDCALYRHRYVRAGNQSGKTSLAAREVAWVLEECHPHWPRPEFWKDEPLVILAVARIAAHAEEVLWRKIKGFLNPANYHEVRIGGALQKVEHVNGNVIIFASHHSPNEAREKLQAYVAHYVWLDEMPNSVQLIEELHRRVQARQGRFLATFTPKVRNDAVRKLVDGAVAPLAKVYRLKMLDNPIYVGREQEERESLKSFSQEYQNTILEGDWFAGDEAVYCYSATRHNQEPEYSAAWRHVVLVDPAGASKLGLLVVAERPTDGVWFPVQAEYIPGNAGSVLVAEVERRVRHLNILERRSDPHEAWFIKEARLHTPPLSYKGVYKNKIKKELINSVNEALESGRAKLSSYCTLLADELTSCSWNDNLDKIVNARRFHLADCFQYFCNNIPKHEPGKSVALPWEAQLRAAHHARVVAEEAKKTKGTQKWRITSRGGKSWKHLRGGSVAR